MSADVTPRYGPPPSPQPLARPPRTSRSGAENAGRALLALASLVLGGGAALVAGFIGSVVYTGCFIGCNADSADPLGGTALYALAVGLAAAALWGAVAAFRRPRPSRRAWAVVAAAVAGTAAAGVCASVAATVLDSVAPRTCNGYGYCTVDEPWAMTGTVVLAACVVVPLAAAAFHARRSWQRG